MKKLIQCKINILFFVLITCFSLSNPASAGSFADNILPVVYTESSNQLIPFAADIIVTKYRTYNGRQQYRRWNDTKNEWVDPAWIDI